MAPISDIANRRARLDAAAASLFASSIRRLIARGKLQVIEGLIVVDRKRS